MTATVQYDFNSSPVGPTQINARRRWSSTICNGPRPHPSSTPVGYHTYQLPSVPLTVRVSFDAPATGLVTVDVDQSEYDFNFTQRT